MDSQLSFNPWKTIWTKPRQTIRGIVEKNPSQGLIPLSAIYGFPLLVYLAQMFSMGRIWPTWAIILVALLVSPVIGFLGLSLWSIIAKWTGQWFGGKGSYKEILAVAAWTSIPHLVNGIIWVVLAVFIGSPLFAPVSEGNIPIVAMRIVGGLLIVQSVMSIWAFVILIVALSEVQNFSVIRAIGNVIASGVLLIILAWVLSVIALGIQA
ncbi:MAG: YIP1 family protein [Anaplasmataceae bacterium]|nr:YIP1 family protein [Anaplasmataceae bacterium]